MERQRRGFTLVELLVVIGIIAVLLAILVPVVNKVRISVHNANTKNMLTQVSGAIQQYHNDYQAYPGPTPAQAYQTTVPAGIVMVVAKMTSSEDLTLALVGGTSVTAFGPPLVLAFDKNLVGQGPVSLNKLNPGQKKAYMAYRKEEFSNGQLSAEPGYQYVIDTPVPELMDTYADRRPILYLRANSAKQGVDESKLVSNGYKADTHYNLFGVLGYANRSALPADQEPLAKVNPGTVPVTDPDVIKAFKSPFSTSTVVTAKNAGSYMLISAGPDRKYMTDDDIIVGGSGGQ